MNVLYNFCLKNVRVWEEFHAFGIMEVFELYNISDWDNLTYLYPGNYNDSQFNCHPILYPYWYVMYGILFPILAICTFCTNILVIIVFTMNKMRSPTTILLTALAVSDILAVIFITPLYIYFYSLENVRNYSEGLSYPLCIYHSLAYKLSAIFHFVSVWLTVVLGVQRYIVVAFPIPGRQLCSQRNSVLTILAVYLIVLAVFSMWFVSDRFEEASTVTQDGVIKHYCRCYKEHVSEIDLANVVIVIRLMFGQIIPCVLLSIATVALVQKLIVESKRILHLHKEDDDEGERTDFRLIRRTTIMVILIVILFILVEVPLSIIFALDLYDYRIIPRELKWKMAVIFNFFLVVTYQGNFWIYVCLSKHFRDNLRKLFGFRKSNTNYNGTNSMHSRSCYSKYSVELRKVPLIH